jgi:hypothetical protein
VIDNDLVAVDPFESFTCTVKVDVPALIGVPAITPVELVNVKPPGRLPEVTDQL